jgi:hypothetical protein
VARPVCPVAAAPDGRLTLSLVALLALALLALALLAQVRVGLDGKGLLVYCCFRHLLVHACVGVAGWHHAWVCEVCVRGCVSIINYRTALSNW